MCLGFDKNIEEQMEKTESCGNSAILPQNLGLEEAWK